MDGGLPATHLVQPASRVSWRFAVAGPDRQAKQFADWAAAQARRADVRGVRIESFETGRPEMRQTLDRIAYVRERATFCRPEIRRQCR